MQTDRVYCEKTSATDHDGDGDLTFVVTLAHVTGRLWRAADTQEERPLDADRHRLFWKQVRRARLPRSVHSRHAIPGLDLE